MGEVTVSVGDEFVTVEVPTHVVDVEVSTTAVDVTVDDVGVDVSVDESIVYVTVPDENVQIYTSEPIIDVDVVGVEGKPGPQGDPGPKGDPGPPGPGGLASQYVHTQSMLSPSWVIEHNLGKHPEITCEDGAGSVIYGSIEYLSNTTALVGFAFSITGKANCT